MELVRTPEERQHQGTKLTEEEISEIKQMREEGKTLRQIQAEKGYARDTITRYTSSDHPDRKKYGRRTTATDIMRFRELAQQGLSHTQIAKETGFCADTIYRYLGKQKAGNRAAYGSIVTHPSGESFLPPKKKEQEKQPDISELPPFMPCSKRVEMEEKAPMRVDATYHGPILPEKKPEPKPGKRLTQRIVSYTGKTANYALDMMTRKVTILYRENSFEADFEEFQSMLEEILELLDVIPVSQK